MKKFLWLFGENLGNTANNNSFYFWQHIVEIEDKIDKKFIMAKNKQNKKIYKTLTQKAKKNIIWKNSIKHYLVYNKADMLYVSLSYKDVEPKRILKRVLKTPIVYLQHGTLAIKKIGYEGNSYNNNMFRFLYYNKDIKDILIEENKFKEYQLYYAEFHPRYMELIKRYEQFNKNKSSEKNKNILWFITWREYFGDNKETERLIENIKNVINNYKIREYLKNSNSKLKICLHQFFDKKKIEYMTDKLKNQNIEIVTPKQIDIMDEIIKNDILITDYSSIGFDFTLLGKKVILYQPDIKDYSNVREFYYLEEMEKYSIKTPTKLVQELEKEYQVNNFFRNKLPDKIDFDNIKQGKYIDRLYDEFKTIQENEITFIGYNFYGKGGTISATLALAEGLLEKKYLVKLISLKKHIKKGKFPFGLNVNALYFSKRKTIQYILKRLLFYSKKHYGYLKYDSNKSNLIPYVGYALRKKLNNIKSKTVVSTRETLHLFLKHAKSENIENKVYFFHTYYNVVQKQFCGLLDELKKIRIEKAVFITKAGQEQYKNKVNYDNYNEYEIISNCIESSKMITRDEIKPLKKKKKYHSVYMLRISKDRINDIDNLINFAKFMKKNKFNMLVIHVYGVGDYLQDFLMRLEEEKVTSYIKYEGLATDIKTELSKWDLVTDFSLNHSFGMTYLEAILNGKMVFGMKNQGSSEVFKEIPYSYINSYLDLMKKIKNLSQIKIDTLQTNYDIMYKDYSREVMADKFIDYINYKRDDKNE